MEDSTDLNDLEVSAQRERILLCGQPTVGKTYSVYALADYVALKDPDAKIFVLDVDRGMGKVKREWPNVNNIEYYLARKWDGVERFMDKVGPKQKARDWVIIDMIGRCWELAQSFEVGIVHEESMGKRMLEARRQLVAASKLQAPSSLPQPDWTVIKKLHNDMFIDEISIEWDAHVVATTSIDPLDMERDDGLLTSIFQSYGWKPDGEKRNVHRFDTIAFMEIVGKKRRLTTIKDRGRPLLTRLEFGSNLWEAFAEALEKKNFSFADSLQ